jgi:hypothetical protein
LIVIDDFLDRFVVGAVVILQHAQAGADQVVELAVVGRAEKYP